MKKLRKLYVNDLDFYKNTCSIAIPVALQSMITIGVNMIDNIMVAALGEKALSAVSLANQYTHVFYIFCMGTGMGAAVLVSRYWGMGENESLKKTVAIMLRLILGIATLFMIAAAFFPSGIMGMYTGDTELWTMGTTYLLYSLPTFYLMGISLTLTIVLRGIGRVKVTLITSIITFAINVGANYILIFGHFGAPRMGIAGAALGTVTARSVEFMVVIVYIFFYEKKMHFRFRNLFMKTRSLLGEYFRISIPVVISDAILALGNNSVTMIIGHLGSEFVAANAITSVTQQLSTVFIEGISQASAIVTGHTLGKGEREKAYSQGYAFMGLGIFLGIISATFVLLSGKHMIAMYQVSGETARIAWQLICAISFILLFMAPGNIMTKGTLRGGGDTKILMIADNVFLWCASIPLGILAGFVWKVSPFWIYFIIKIDQILKAIWCTYRLKSGKWIKKVGK